VWAHLRRPTSIWGLAGLITAACVTATHASAAPAPTLFQLSITGNATARWTHRGASEQSGNCTRTVTSEGIRNTQFRTAAPVVVRIRDGRVLATDLRGLTGTVTLSGANSIDENCGGVDSGRIEDCVTTKRSFSGGRTRVSSPRPGFLDLGRARNVRLRAADCPREPAEVRQRPLGPPLRTLRLPEEALNEQRVASMTVRATGTRRTTYVAPEAGTLRERTEWRLRFVRAKR
jgi:hypothetical protein